MSDLTFSMATLALRPPRVAILFPDDANWRNWVMRALEVASEYWGGGGFILVPHDAVTGEPPAEFARIVRAYDPDHVVTLKIPVPEFESWYPGSISVPDAASDEDRAALIREVRHDVASTASDRARGIVASWCSPLRSALVRRGQRAPAHEAHKSLRAVRRGDRLSRGLPVAPVPDTSVFAASSAWRSDLGLLVAARAGVVDDGEQLRAEPGADVVEWAVRREGGAPASIVHIPEIAQEFGGEPPTRFDAHPGLLKVSRGLAQDMAAVIVGDTCADFALALAYDRLLGRGIWVTSTMLEDTDVLRNLRSSLWWVRSQLEQQAAYLTVSSASLSGIDLAAANSRLQEPNYEFELRGRHREMVDESDIVQLRAPQLDRSYTELVVEEHLGASLVLPMVATGDGTLEAMNGVESPVPSSLMYPVSSGKVPYWYVDVAFARHAAPRGRDLPASGMLAVDPGRFPEVALRASKDGVTFDPTSMGLVFGGSLLPGRLGRPRLRAPSMWAWVEGMAAAAGLGVRLSPPGRQAELVSRRLGSRDALIDLTSASTLPLLRAFIPRDKVPKTREPGVVVVGVDPYLSFAKISELMGSDVQALEIVDTLTAARLARRGLVLRCQECVRTSFVDADRVGQHYECPQCAAVNSLVSARWREGNEPSWFYDLYTPFRGLMRDHGDIPLLAAAELKRNRRSYTDVAELEFYDPESGKPVAEIDLIASVDDEVVLVEAKSNGQFGSGARGKQTVKILRIAQALRADRVVLATSEPEWNATDVAHLQQETAKLGPIKVVGEAMTRLGAR